MTKTVKNLLLLALTTASFSLFAATGESLVDTVSRIATKSVCNLYAASSVMAQGVNVVSPELKQTAKKVCCRYQDFRDANPNTVNNALDKCAGVAIDDQPLEEDVCSFVAVSGRYLDKAPSMVKKVLKDRCCVYEDVMADNPQAAKALGCDQ
jgi:hypothetical protein